MEIVIKSYKKLLFGININDDISNIILTFLLNTEIIGEYEKLIEKYYPYKNFITKIKLIKTPVFNLYNFVNLQILNLDKFFNHKLEKNMLPPNLKQLIFPTNSNYNNLFIDSLPDSLIILKIGINYSQMFYRNHLPADLHIIFYIHTIPVVFHTSLFNMDMMYLPTTYDMMDNYDWSKYSTMIYKYS